MLAHLGRYYSLKNVSAEVSFGTVSSLAGRGVPQDSAAHVSLSSIFNFQRTDTCKRSVVGQSAFALRARSSVAYAALCDFVEGSVRSELLGRQRRAALVCEAVYTGGPRMSQRRFSTFLNFLRQFVRKPFGRCVRGRKKLLERAFGERA